MLGPLNGWIKKIKTQWLTISVIVLLLLGCWFLYHLVSTPSGFSQPEATYKFSSSSLHNVINNSINLPHKLLALGFNRAGLVQRAPLRLISIVYGAIFSLCFYILSKSLFGKTVGLLGTVIFSLTPLFIIASRQNTADILLFSPIVIMAAYAWLLRTEKHKGLAWLLLLATSAIFIYVPGLIWWLAGGVILARKKIAAVVAEIPTPVIAFGVGMFSVMLIPAAISIAGNWLVIKEFLLIPVHLGSALEILKRIIWMAAALIVKTPYHDQLIISRVPILDIIQLVLAVFGGFAMLSAARARAIVLLGAVAFSILAAAINANLHLLALGLPAIAIFMAAGLRYLYIEWRGIFPRNPIPKTLALALMIALVSVQAIYGLSYGLIAWPHASSTQSDYVLK